MSDQLQTIYNIPGLRRGGRISSSRDDQLGAEIKFSQIIPFQISEPQEFTHFYKNSKIWEFL